MPEIPSHSNPTSKSTFSAKTSFLNSLYFIPAWNEGEVDWPLSLVNVAHIGLLASLISNIWRLQALGVSPHHPHQHHLGCHSAVRLLPLQSSSDPGRQWSMRGVQEEEAWKLFILHQPDLLPYRTCLCWNKSSLQLSKGAGALSMVADYCPVSHRWLPAVHKNLLRWI